VSLKLIEQLSLAGSDTRPNEDSFAVSDELLEAFGLPVLGSVSRVNAVSQQLEMRHSAVMMTSGLAMLAALYGVLILISQWHVF